MNLIKSSFVLALLLTLTACSTTTTSNVTSAKNSGKTSVTKSLDDHEKVIFSEGIKQLVAENGEIEIENNEDIVCTRNRRTGTRVGKTRVCTTRTEYNEKQRQTREMMRSRDSTRTSGAVGN